MTENEIEDVVDNAKGAAMHPLLADLSEDEQQEIYKIARRKAGGRIGLYIHAIVFVLVMAFMVVLNVAFTPDYLWVKWPLGGWGVALFFHWLGNSIIPNVASDLEEKEIIRELEARR